MITVPIWPEFVRPVLTYLSDDQVRSNREIRTASYDLLNLDDVARAEVLPSGQSRAENRAGWAITHLVKADWITRITRGHYRITPTGREWLSANPGGFHDYASAGKELFSFWETDVTPAASEHVADMVEATIDPIEQIENAVASLDASVAADLLERLRKSDPSFFEDAVVKVLLAMGYGGTEKQGKTIGGTGDGGVDGVIDQDALGLDQIYVQAKRYTEGNKVPGQEIQAFVGAVLQRGASRGVFLTTSDFTPAARAAGDASHHVRIVLINGERLATLMIKHRVGVQVKQTYHVVDVDEDFFE